MNSRQYGYLPHVIITLAVITLTFSACITSPPIPQGPSTSASINAASFTFRPPVVTPLSVVAGHPFTVSLQVVNTGLAQGSYKADLYVDGSLVDSVVLAIAPHQSADASFKVTLNDTVMHQIKLGPQIISIAAGENRIPITIKIDNGVVDGCDPVAGITANPSEVVPQNDGNLIKLTAPPGGISITGIEIVGYIKSSTYDFDHDPVFGPGIWVYGPDIASAAPVNPDFAVNIYGDHRNKLFSGTYSKQLFSYAPMTVTVPVPAIQVSGDFYIELLTNNMPRLNALGLIDRDLYGRYIVHTWYYQLCVAYESANDVQSWISEDGSAVPFRYLTYNWIIRADGYQVQK